MKAYAEEYLNDVVENQGKLFDYVAQNFPDKDTEEFINFYMKSKTRKSIDESQGGTPAVETRRKHLTPQWYKKVTAMDAKLEQLEATLNNINVFNAGKKREEAVALLAQLLPEVESFQAETQQLRDTIAHERRNASFQREINADLCVRRSKSAA